MGAVCDGDNGCCCEIGEFCSTFVTGQGGPGECQSSVVPPTPTTTISKTRGTHQGTTDYGPRGQKQTFSNFVDADNMDSSTMPDSDFMNHPGLFGWCWAGKRKCEARRQEKSYSSINSKHPFSKNDDCDTLDDRITKLTTL